LRRISERQGLNGESWCNYLIALCYKRYWASRRVSVIDLNISCNCCVMSCAQIFPVIAVLCVPTATFSPTELWKFYGPFQLFRSISVLYMWTCMRYPYIALPSIGVSGNSALYC
jgi:hypothetical protein